MRKAGIYLFITAGLLLVGTVLFLVFRETRNPESRFDGQKAYQHVLAQVAFGPRTPASAAHAQVIAYIQQELTHAGWLSEIQTTEWQDFPVQNIIATRSHSSPQILLGAHYDSRILADQDTGPGRYKPVLGANDGASGVAVLLELARILPLDTLPVWLVFFDAEDNGGLGGRDWIMGSRAFVASFSEQPRAVIIIDMVGDADLDFYIEHNSDPDLASKIWAQAAALGYGEQFIPEPGHSWIDDHTPFLEAGIPAVDIIDYDYSYWHTSADTADKVSPESLQIVGETLRVWILTQQ